MPQQKKSLGVGRLPNIMPNYPHMLVEDRDLWTKFLETKEFEIDRVWYDVHCGLGLPVPGGIDSMEYKISQGVTRKRIDVICSVKDELWIIEIKPHANMGALGQIITYERLFYDEYITDLMVVPVILCWSMDPDIAEILRQNDVRIMHPGKSN